MGDTRATPVKERTIDIAAFLSGAKPQPSAYARSIEGSTILKIAGDIRELLAQGEKVLNLTVGDFRPDQFPIPAELTDEIVAALRRGESNYPPVAGMVELREAIRERTLADFGLDYPLTGVLVGGGARPLLYATYMATVDPGDTVVYPVPSWNNHYYVNLAGARGVSLPVTPQKNFHLDRSDLEPHLSKARLIVLNSPLNPTGTCFSRDQLQGIGEAIAEENERRQRANERPVFLAYDQVYCTLTFNETEHYTPVGLVPEIAPYTIMIDAVSKGLCGTGLRVGWAVGSPTILERMTAMAGHYGAWAPRAEQIGTARFLRQPDALRAHRELMKRELMARLSVLDEGFAAMRADGLPVEHIEPQGAMYLSVRFALHGKTVGGTTIDTSEDLRTVLLRDAGFAVVPFDAFGLDDEGWVRLSVGAVSVEEIREGLERVRGLLAGV